MGSNLLAVFRRRRLPSGAATCPAIVVRDENQAQVPSGSGARQRRPPRRSGLGMRRPVPGPAGQTGSGPCAPRRPKLREAMNSASSFGSATGGAPRVRDVTRSCGPLAVAPVGRRHRVSLPGSVRVCPHGEHRIPRRSSPASCDAGVPGRRRRPARAFVPSSAPRLPRSDRPPRFCHGRRPIRILPPSPPPAVCPLGRPRLVSRSRDGAGPDAVDWLSTPLPRRRDRGALLQMAGMRRNEGQRTAPGPTSTTWPTPTGCLVTIAAGRRTRGARPTTFGS